MYMQKLFSKLPLITLYLRRINFVSFELPPIIQNFNSLVTGCSRYLLLFYFTKDLWLFLCLCDVFISSGIFINHLEKFNSSFSIRNVLWTSTLNFIVTHSVTELLWVAPGDITPKGNVKKSLILII